MVLICPSTGSRLRPSGKRSGRAGADSFRSCLGYLWLSANLVPGGLIFRISGLAD